MFLETLTVRREGAVLFADIAAPPMNLLGPELVRDLVTLIQDAEADDTVQVLVFASADPDYFISHVDLNRISEYRAEAAKLTGEASIALLFHHLSASRLVTIAKIEGRVRAAGSEFVLACDMRFAARESAIFCQFEPAFGLLPGGGAAQHLVRLMGRARALEVMLSAQDYDAELAERYGWINRAMPADELDDFVRSLAHRVAGFPAIGHVYDANGQPLIALAREYRRCAQELDHRSEQVVVTVMHEHEAEPGQEELQRETEARAVVQRPEQHRDDHCREHDAKARR